MSTPSSVTRVHIPEVVDTDHRLGRHVEHDERSREYGVVTAPVPLVAVRHKRMGSIFNQGDIGSCTGNAGAGCVNTVPVWKKARRVLGEADAVKFYKAATIIDGFPGVYPPDDTGSSGLAVCKVMKAMGFISGYQHSFSVATSLQALMKNSLMIGINWYGGFDQPDKDGLVKISGEIRGGHEVEVDEYIPSTTKSKLDALLGLDNSWSLAWGLHGRFYMTVRMFTQLMSEQGDCTVPLPLL